MRWLQATRPLAHWNIAPPLVYGQAFAFAIFGTWSWRWFAVAMLFGVLDHLYIVFANDYADRDADRLNTSSTWFSGGSRVIPEGRIAAEDVLTASWLAATALVVLAAATAWLAHRWWMVPLTLAGLVLMHAYSFKPLRLSYRGHGEWLQAFGTGAVLPAVGYYLQLGSFTRLPWMAFVPPVMLGLASNVLTALPDTKADSLAGKRALPVRWGEFRARLCALVYVLAAGLSPFLGHREIHDPFFIGAPVVACLLLVAAGSIIRRADSTNRTLCMTFVLLVSAAIQVLYAGWIVSLLLRGARG